MALNTVTLTWDLADFLQVGIPDQCTIFVTPTFLLADNTDNVIIPAITRSVTFSGGTGSLAGIVANDNSQLVPTGSTYTISVLDRSTDKTIVGPFTAAINYANGSTQDLSYLYNNQAFTYPSFFQYTTQNSFAGSIAGSQFNVIAYGADPTGVKDSTTAVTAAFNAATAAGGGYVFYPPGTFKQGTLSIPGVATTRLYVGSNVHFMFSGVGCTILVPNAANTPLFKVNTSTYPTAAGVRFTGGFTIQAHASGSIGAAIDLTGARQFVIESPSYWDSSKGVSGSPGTYAQVISLGNNSYANHIVNPICEAQHIGSSFIGVPAVTGIASNNNTITNPLVENCTVPYVIDAAGTGELHVKGGILEGNTCTAAIRLGSTTHVREVHFEANTAFAMDNHGVDSTDPGSCWLESNTYNGGSGTFTIPASTGGYNNFIGGLGAMTVVDNAPASSMNSYGARLVPLSVNNGEIYLPQGGVQLGPYIVPTTTGTVTLSMAHGAYQRIVMTGNITLASIGNASDGQELVVEIVQPNSGGPYTVGWNAQFVFGGSSAVASTAANSVSHYVFRFSGSSNKWICHSREDSSGKPVALNVVDFGADPAGISDSTTAIQAAINRATGSAAPASNTRTPVFPVYLPPGTYKVTSDLNIQSVSGFRLMGAGISQSVIKASGTGFTQAVVFIDGSSDGIFEGFAVQGDGTEAAGAGTLPNGIRLDWTTAAQRSTSGNIFRDIRVRTIKATTLFSLEGNGTRQVDGTNFHNVVVTGGQTAGSWSNTGPWQNGFAFGNGSFGNNYDHVLYGCAASLCYTGINCSVSSFALYGSQPAGNAVDFNISPGAQCTVSNVQSQQCGTFLICPGGFSPLPVTFQDVLIKTTVPSTSVSPGYQMISIIGGVWHFKNIAFSGVSSSGTYFPGTISLAGSSGVRPVTATFHNMTNVGSRTALFTTLTNANVVVNNYIQYAPATGNFTAPAAGDLVSTYSGGAWSNISASTLPNTQFFTSSGTWTKPTGAQTVRVAVLGGGGGGGSGASGASGTALVGGGGGGGQPVITREFVASDLGATVAITVGAGGAGGASVTGTVGTTNGNNGGGGPTSSFGTFLLSRGAGAGGGGQAAAGGAAGASAYGTTTQLGAGSAGSVSGGPGAGLNQTVVPGAPGAASGGGITTGAVAGAGAGGNTSIMDTSAIAGAAGVVGGASPTSGTASTITNGSTGPSPGSGAASTTGAAQAGANGLPNTGVGGAGGGASLNGSASGAGGNGGSGWVLVITYFQ